MSIIFVVSIGIGIFFKNCELHEKWKFICIYASECGQRKE